MGTKARVLVVDDDPGLRKSLSDILRVKGHAPGAVDSGKTALERIKDEIPAVAVIDLRLEDMSGLEVMREIKKRYPSTECIVLTGHASQASAIEAVNLGAYGYMQKPCDVEQLVLTIRRAIEKREAEEALRKAHDELERRVEERTANLVKANEQLKQEIEERKRLEKALVQKEKLNTLGAIAAEVAHEIRNPLVAIGGFARRLQKRFPDLRECDIMLRESRRLEKILDRIRNYLKPVQIRYQECSANTVISDCLDLLSPEMDRRGVTCRLSLDPALPIVYVDPDILTQISINLIRNAAEAMDKRGTLLIKTFESENKIHIDFKNEAQGQKIKDSELLFLPFDEGGQSIGLPLCYRLVRKMGGILSFAQEENFTVFTISLPKTVRQDSDVQHGAELSQMLPEQIMRTEKRRFPRAEVKWPCIIQSGVKSVKGQIENISVGGAFICCQIPLKLNDTFQIVIHAANRHSLSVTAELVRPNVNGPDNLTMSQGMGARFIRISSEQRRLLNEVIPHQ